MVSTKLIASGLIIATTGSGALITKSFFPEKPKAIDKKLKSEVSGSSKKEDQSKETRKNANAEDSSEKVN